MRLENGWLIYEDFHGYQTWIKLDEIKVMYPGDDYLDVFLDVIVDGEGEGKAAHETNAWHRVPARNPIGAAMEIAENLSVWRFQR